MTKRKETEVSGDLEPRVGPEVEATDKPLSQWSEGDASAFVGRENERIAYADAVQAARERFSLLREVLTHTHATARLPADLLRRIQEAVN